MSDDVKATIYRVDHRDDGPIESIHRHYFGTLEGLELEVKILNAANFRVPKHPDLRDLTGDLFHKSSEFRFVMENQE